VVVGGQSLTPFEDQETQAMILVGLAGSPASPAWQPVDPDQFLETRAEPDPASRVPSRNAADRLGIWLVRARLTGWGRSAMRI